MYYIHMIDMPAKTKATHTINSDGTYTIFVNSKLNYAQQQLGCLHEIKHIERQDLQNECHADEIELYAHKEIIDGYTKKEW